MRLVEIAVQRRVTILMFTLAIALFGFVSLSRLKVNLLPDLSYPTLTIRTELTGAAPLEVENLLSKPIEEAMGVIKNVRQVRSVSRSGQSDVIIEFLWGTDMDFAGVDVREKLDLLELPLEAGRPLLLRFDPSGERIMRLALLDNHSPAESSTALPGLRSENCDFRTASVSTSLQPAATATPSCVASSAEADRLKALRRFGEDQIKIQLESVEGTAAVKISGGLEDEIQVRVDQQKLAQLNLSIAGVAGRLRAENVNLSGGRLEQGSQRFLVRTINEFRNVDEIAAAIVAMPGGRPVYLRDIATVHRSYKEREAITRVDGRESVELAVYKEGDGNTVLIAAQLEDHLAGIRESLPDGFELTTIYDQSRFISSAIDEVKSAALLGGLLAILVLYFFLRDLRATLIIGLAIPISVVGTFVAMYAADLSLNIMSLGGIALAIGMLVDNSIVVLENIVRKKEGGLAPRAAAVQGTGEVAMAVTASTLTTVAVFFPMVFVSGIAGQLFRDQALTVTFALVLSLIVALTLVPMLAALGAGHRFTDAVDERPPERFTRGAGATLGLFRRLIAFFGRMSSWLFWPFVRLFQGSNGALARVYPRMLAASLRHRLLVVAGAALIFAGAMSLVPRLGTELIPQLSQGEFNLDLRMPPGTPLEQSDEAVQAAQRSAAALPDATLVYSVTGTGNRLDANPVDSGDNYGNLSIRLAEGADRATEERAMEAMREDLRKLPGVQFEFKRPALFSFSTPLAIEISGYDLEGLRSTSARLVAALEASDRFTDVETTIESGNPEIQIVFDHDRAARLGVAVRDIADRVVSNVRGDVATRYSWRDKKVDVLVRSVDARDASIEEIRRLIVNPASARPVPLEAVADIRVALGPAEIRRIDQERTALVSANLGFGDLGAAVVEAERIIDRTPMPFGITATVSGQNEEMQQSMASMQFTLAMAIFLVYLVMASQFESLIHPFVIMFTIPLALVGAVLALYVTGTTLNVVAFIGIIMLAGIVVNNAIVLIDLVNQRRAQGVEKTAALIEAGIARLRPILMTTLTTVLGLLPMAIGFGDGAEVRAPMAITVIGGLVTSTLLTLFVVPVVYSLLDRKRLTSLPSGEGAEESGALGSA
ncbi:MAG: efflux RND transporter permease subunit [Gammaproteobacteria bacterium]|nr:efflux RND transporter permease subunit [Gammaproteobacteria bacterium]